MQKILINFDDLMTKRINYSDEMDNKTIDADSGVDYAAEYKRQTGRDLETGEYVTQ